MKKIDNAKMGYVLALLVVLLLVGLPIAVWLDLSNLVERPICVVKLVT
jgi:hypothetical protein